MSYNIEHILFIENSPIKKIENALWFWVNTVPFCLLLAKSKLLYPFFIEDQSKLFNYIKTKQFIDDLQDKLFETDNYKYAAEEVQWIISKNGLCKDVYIATELKEILDKINPNNPVYFATKYHINNIHKELNLINPTFDAYIKNKYNNNRISDLMIKWFVMSYVLENYPENYIDFKYF